MSTVETALTSLEEADRNHILHPFTSVRDHFENGPLHMVEGQGIYIKDSRGREYIDAVAGLWCVNIGYGRPEMVQAIAAQCEKLPFYHSFLGYGNEPAAELAERITALAPEGLNRAFFANSGSEANDTQVKLVWQYNNLRGKAKKKKIISRDGAYHGVTLGAASLCGLPAVHKTFDLPLDGFLHVRKPHHYWEAEAGQSEKDFSAKLAQELDECIQREGPDTVAAFIAEPVMGAGGVIPPPEGYFEAIVPVLNEHDVLFIADEVICGFGRLGAMFGSDRYQLQPDLMTLAKGLTSGYVPMSACLVSDKVWDVLLEGSGELGPFSHGYTYSAHPLAAAAGLTSLDIIQREGLVANADSVGAHLHARLADAVADHPLVGETRGVGLVAGIELVADKQAKKAFGPDVKIGMRLRAKLLDEGLVVRPVQNTIAFSPALVITESEVDEIVARFLRGLEVFADDLVADGTWQPPRD